VLVLSAGMILKNGLRLHKDSTTKFPLETAISLIARVKSDEKSVLTRVIRLMTYYFFVSVLLRGVEESSSHHAEDTRGTQNYPLFRHVKQQLKPISVAAKNNTLKDKEFKEQYKGS
jgi:hypothetical protein